MSSAILSADDLNDFISPGVACIKPVETLPPKDNGSAENAYEVTTEDKVAAEELPPAQISLTDCLACSGCVTSAEAVLVSLQSHAEVLNTLDEHREIRVPEAGALDQGPGVPEDGKIFVASVSPQVRASLAATYGISERDAGGLIDQFLSGPQGLRSGGNQGSGFSWVVDTNIMRQVVLELTAGEVAESLANSGSSLATTDSADDFPLPSRPILSSACPGWICYAEKTHPHVLPHLSRLKSPQALTGTLIKTVLSKKLGVHPSRIWHLAIMPCFDKKLEASRQELTDVSWQNPESTIAPSTDTTPSRDVDCVITSRELLMLASTRNIPLQDLPRHSLARSFSTSFPDQAIASFLFPTRRSSSNQQPGSGTSGGYLHNVLATYQARNPNSTITAQRGRNADVVDYTLVSETGEPIIKAARYYGFRNIQNLVRKLRPARASKLPGAKAVSTRRAGSARAGAPGAATEYAYVEVMACPGGCTNGGGQIRLEDAQEANSSPSADSTEQIEYDKMETDQKPTPNDQRAWLSRVDEAYYSADSLPSSPSLSGSDSIPDSDFDSDSENRDHPQPGPTTNPISDETSSALKYWSALTNIPLSRLVYTTFRKVESDVGKNNVSDTARIAELAGKAGGGW